MQFTPLDKKARAEWLEMLNPTQGTRLAAAALLFFLSSLALPLCKIEAVAGLYLIYAVLFYYMLTHSLAAIVTVGLPGVALYGVSALAPALPHPFLMPAVYAALVLGSVGGAFLVIHCREKKYLPLLALPVAAYAIAIAPAGPYLALCVLIPTALAPVLGHGMLVCRPQTPVLVTLSAVLAAVGVGAFLVFYGLCGWPVANPLAYFGDLVRGGITSFCHTAIEVYAAEGLVLPLSETDIHNLSAMLGNILPGLFLAGCGILSFVIYRTCLRVLTAWGTLSRVPLRIGAMTVSPLAAGLFILAALCSLFGGTGRFGTVCENISLVLEPALVLVGVTSLFTPDPKRGSRISLLLLICLALLLFNYPALALSAAALLGAVRILLAAILGLRGKKGANK
jgi:hypothetical protein